VVSAYADGEAGADAVAPPSVRDNQNLLPERTVVPRSRGWHGTAAPAGHGAARRGREDRGHLDPQSDPVGLFLRRSGGGPDGTGLLARASGRRARAPRPHSRYRVTELPPVPADRAGHTMWMPQPCSPSCLNAAFKSYGRRAWRRGYPAGYRPGARGRRTGRTRTRQISQRGPIRGPGVHDDGAGRAGCAFRRASGLTESCPVSHRRGGTEVHLRSHHDPGTMVAWHPNGRLVAGRGY
jgi:hypothetical protein